MNGNRNRRLVLTGMVVAFVAYVALIDGSGWSYQAAPSTEGTGPARYPTQTQKLAPDNNGTASAGNGAGPDILPRQQTLRGTPFGSPVGEQATPFPEGTGPARFPTPTPTIPGTP